MMFFVAEDRGKTVAWQCANREVAERQARKHFGHDVKVRQISICEYQKLPGGRLSAK